MKNSLLFVVCCLCTSTLFAQERSNTSYETHTHDSPNHRSMQAIRISDAPNVNGVLDDAVWQRIKFTGDFIQRVPNEGAPPSNNTEIAVVYDDKNLYVAARCYDTEPDKIKGTEMRRDASPGRDDYFDVVIDTFHDRRSANFFTTTPAGGRLDGVVSEDGKIDNRDWDGIWRSKTSRDDKGWYVEIAIPWQTLRFSDDDEQVWGIQFVRRTIRTNEEVFWRLVPLDAGRLGQNRISEAGDLYGLKGLKQGGRLEFKPYIIGGTQKDSYTDFKAENKSDFGGRVKWNISSSMTADFTYNTDFAQVEADQERVNLTRFSLFFPEKRDFFLEGAETFAFGSEGINPYAARAGNIQLFYSRRLGLIDGQKVPITGGARVNGKIGENTSLGLLSIRTERTLYDDDSGDYIPQADYNVIRLKQNIFSRSSVGVMLLNKQEDGGDYNRSFGLDSNFNLTDRFGLFFMGASTFSPDEAGLPSNKKNNFAGNTGFQYDSDLWKYSASILSINERFNPEMGYIQRTGLRKTSARISYAPRPKSIKSIRQITYTGSSYYQTDMSNNLLNRRFTSSAAIQFQSTANFRVSVNHETEFLDFDWDVREGLLIPIGTYSNSTASMSYSTSRAKNLSVNGSINGGDYFTGSKTGGGLGANLLAMGRIIANVSYGYNNISLPDGTFHTNRFSGRVSYSFSPDMYVKAFLQWYDDARLNEGKDRFSGNVIFRYTYIPGSDLYVVYNQERLFGPGIDYDTNRTFIAKLTYFIRK